ncbi:MAG: YhbY family RNA-binding protein [Bacilli bacterium]
MLTNKQKSQLKSMSANLDCKYQVGKSSITDNLICMLDKALIAKELIKIEVNNNLDAPILEIAYDLSSKLNAEIVQVIGRTILLYRKNKDKQIIKLK